MQYDGSKCPLCHAGDVRGLAFTPYGADKAYRDCSCVGCEATWTEELAVVGYSGLAKQFSDVPEEPSEWHANPRVIVLVEGGLVQAAMANVPMDMDVIDRDTQQRLAILVEEGLADEDELAQHELYQQLDEEYDTPDRLTEVVF